MATASTRTRPTTRRGATGGPASARRCSPALAAWSVGDLGGWAALPAYLLFAWLTVGLTWIDLDVHRLPVGLVVPTGAWLVALLAVASVAQPSTGAGWGRSVGALAMGAVYLLLAVLPGGGVGGGDVRLAPVIGGLLGWLGAGSRRRGAAGRRSSSAGWPPWPCSPCGGWGCAARSPTARRCAWGRGSAIGVRVPDPDLARWAAEGRVEGFATCCVG